VSSKLPSSTSSLLSSVITALARTSAYPGTTAAFARTLSSFIISKSGRRGILPLFFQNLVSARCLLGRACLGRGRTTRPGFALPRTSGSISTLLFQGAGEQQQSTRRRRGRRSREDGAGYGRTVSRRRLFPTNRETGRTALGTRPCPLKQREDSVVQTAVPNKQNPCSESMIAAIDTLITVFGNHCECIAKKCTHLERLPPLASHLLVTYYCRVSVYSPGLEAKKLTINLYVFSGNRNPHILDQDSRIDRLTYSNSHTQWVIPYRRINANLFKLQITTFC